MGCPELLLGSLMRRTKRVVNQNHLDKFYPHSLLVFSIQLSVAYEHEIIKFAKIWCNGENIVAEVRAIKEILETENRDDMVWYTELLLNKYANENVDRLISGIYARLRM
jgi:hypothetical protein